MSFLYSYNPYPQLYSQDRNADGENEEKWFWRNDGITSCVNNNEIDESRCWENSANIGQQVVRVVRRRTTANKKERRRTQSINNAFAELRECIPNVPADTKLSKIKTLRLATSYIGYLLSVLETDDFGHGFKVDITQSRRTSNHQMRGNYQCEKLSDENKRNRGRTGWPQHVWALELKSDTV